jgi:hypothetical protein
MKIKVFRADCAVVVPLESAGCILHTVGPPLVPCILAQFLHIVPIIRAPPLASVVVLPAVVILGASVSVVHGPVGASLIVLVGAAVVVVVVHVAPLALSLQRPGHLVASVGRFIKVSVVPAVVSGGSHLIAEHLLPVRCGPTGPSAAGIIAALSPVKTCGEGNISIVHCVGMFSWNIW